MAPPMKKFNSINDYLNDIPDNTRNALIEIKKIILSAAPEAEEIFKSNYFTYGLIPESKREQQIMVAGYANHIGFSPHSSTISAFIEELQDYKFSKGTVQFPNIKPLPKDLIIQMVQYRKQQLAED